MTRYNLARPNFTCRLNSTATATATATLTSLYPSMPLRPAEGRDRKQHTTRWQLASALCAPSVSNLSLSPNPKRKRKWNFFVSPLADQRNSEGSISCNLPNESCGQQHLQYPIVRLFGCERELSQTSGISHRAFESHQTKSNQIRVRMESNGIESNRFHSD